MSVRRVLVILAVISTAAWASNFSISHVETSPGVYNTQIWIEAEDYDAKTDDFVVDGDVHMASGTALYFPDPQGVSDALSFEPWWSEYSIDSTIIVDPNVVLSGTWYCWIRGNQPVNSNVESDVIFFKGDPCDGSGASWYDDALAGIDTGDDIIGQIYQTGAAGPGNWVWLGETLGSGGREKELVLDGDGKIVFRLSERESGADNVRVDAFCLTDDPGYVPTDADFDSAPVSENLIFLMDASFPGDNANTHWEPVIGNPLATGEFLNSPQLGADAGTLTWYYDFDSEGGYNNDQVIDLGEHADFQVIDKDWCTIEAWIRMPLDAAKPGSGHATKGIIIGNADGADHGWRLSTRDNGYGSKYGITFQQRDNETAQTAFKGTLHYHGGYILDYSDTDWVHVVFVKYEAEYVSSLFRVNHDLYINGELILHGVRPVPASSIDDFYCSPAAPRLGTMRDDMYYIGQTAVVRVYDRLLYGDEVARNYNAGLGSTKTWQCGGVDYDLTGDCLTNLLDFSVIAANWLDSGIVTP